jgi:UDP-N-acetylmuramoyl-L-alanyl-D-glutamate--2,6-diaminopimelate ligase
VRIEDRREAIEHAIAVARPGDAVLLAGVGPQQSIVQRGTLLPWDEAGVAREALERATLTR